jgi:membrane protease YdiL (CAAX protease family)
MSYVPPAGRPPEGRAPEEEQPGQAYPQAGSTPYPTLPTGRERPYTPDAPSPSYPPYSPGGPTAGPTQRASSRGITIATGVAFAALALAFLGVLAGGEPARFVLIGVTLAPLPMLALLAYAGRNSVAARVFTYIWLAILGLGLVLQTYQYLLFGVVTNLGKFMDTATQMLRAQRASPATIQAYSEQMASYIKPGAPAVFGWGTLLIVLSGIIALAMLFRPVRAAVARIVPIDPDNFVHKIALCITTFLLLSSFVPLLALGGRPPLLEFVSSDFAQQSGQAQSLSVTPQDLIYQLVWQVPLALVAAGWPIARRIRQAVARVNIVWPTVWQAVGALVGGVALAFFALLVMEPAIHALWTALGWPTTDANAFGSIMSKLMTPVGAVIIGVVAGVGEEMTFRGLLQPRLGLIGANLLFTAMHAYQYGPDALLSVFIVGLLLGIVKQRTNTSTSAILHGVYNCTQVMSAVLAG